MLGLMSVGMNLVYGTTGLQSFSHGEQVTLGGLMAYVGTQMLHMPLIASAIFAIVIGALTGFIQNEIVWGPLRRRHVGTMQQMIVTIGLSMALQYTFQFFFGGDIKGIVKSVPDSFQLGPITTDMPTLVSALIAICVIVGVTLFLYKTRLGRATRAVSDNAALAAASGINVDQVVRVVWILSCAMAALSGVLLGVYLNGISWNTGATLILLMFAAVTLGGLGTANGALIGSLVIGIVADMSSLVIPNDMRYASALANPHHRSAGAPAGHLRQAAKGGLIHGHHDNHLQRGGRTDRPDHSGVRTRRHRFEHSLRHDGPDEHGPGRFHAPRRLRIRHHAVDGLQPVRLRMRGARARGHLRAAAGHSDAEARTRLSGHGHIGRRGNHPHHRQIDGHDELHRRFRGHLTAGLHREIRIAFAAAGRFDHVPAVDVQ